MNDSRYDIRQEWTGQRKPQYVVRFCDDWVGSHCNSEGAHAIAVHHAMERAQAYIARTGDLFDD